jgi:predicted RNA binding protein YcfA (HicA-like mRNA interferase family)
MKLPVVAGSDAVKALRKVGYEFDEQHGGHLILRPPRRIGGSPFPTTKSWPKEPFGR